MSRAAARPTSPDRASTMAPDRHRRTQERRHDHEITAILLVAIWPDRGAPARAPARARRPASRRQRRGAERGGTDVAAAEKIKIGLITKFPVDFFFTIENAAKDWAAEHPDVELITGQGKAGNDHEGQIAIIESMVAQGVKGIAVTPTGPQVQPRARRRRRPRASRSS